MDDFRPFPFPAALLGNGCMADLTNLSDFQAATEVLGLQVLLGSVIFLSSEVETWKYWMTS